MSFTESLVNIINSKPKEVEVIPSRKLDKVIKGSNVIQILESLAEKTPIDLTKEVIEDGRKMVVTAKWDRFHKTNQAIVSFTENSISFIGNTSSENYMRLEGKNLKDQEKIETSIKKMFSDPTRL